MLPGYITQAPNILIIYKTASSTLSVVNVSCSPRIGRSARMRRLHAEEVKTEDVNSPNLTKRRSSPRRGRREKVGEHVSCYPHCPSIHGSSCRHAGEGDLLGHTGSSLM